MKHSEIRKGSCSVTCGKGTYQIATVTVSGASVEDFKVSNNITTKPCNGHPCSSGIVSYYSLHQCRIYACLCIFCCSSCIIVILVQVAPAEWTEWTKTCSGKCISEDSYPTQSRYDSIVGKNGEYSKIEKRYCEGLQMCKPRFGKLYFNSLLLI